MKYHLPAGGCAYVIALATLFSGCSSISLMGTQSVVSPKRIHTSSDNDKNIPFLISEKKDGDITMGDVELIPAKSYYDSLFESKRDPQNKQLAESYLETGFSLVDTYCVRWFDKLTENQMKTQFTQKEGNIIRDLGREVLKVANANNYITNSYDAIGIAALDSIDLYAEIALLTPDMYVLRTKVLAALEKNKKELRKSFDDNEKILDFITAYSSLEVHSSICSYAGAKQIASKSLEASKPTQTDPSTGEVSVGATDAAVKSNLAEKKENIASASTAEASKEIAEEKVDEASRTFEEAKDATEKTKE